MKLNLGCGTSKIEGYVNVDIDPNVKPDESFDFTEKFPYEDKSIEEVLLYHTIEHIPKKKHPLVIDEIFRVLIPDGIFRVSFPEFTKCVFNWKTNYKGERDFWEATIYGRQSSQFDFHVCIMDSDQFCHFLVNSGFQILSYKPEPNQIHNTVIKCCKFGIYTYEDAIRETVPF